MEPAVVVTTLESREAEGDRSEHCESADLRPTDRDDSMNTERNSVGLSQAARLVT
jgi:hypothetical protein